MTRLLALLVLGACLVGAAPVSARGLPACSYAGRQDVRLGDGTTAHGDVAATDPGGRVRLGRAARVLGPARVTGDVVSLGNGARVGDVATNMLHPGRGAIVGGTVQPAELPLAEPFCAIPAIACGGTDVILRRGDAPRILAAGTHGRLLMANGTALTLGPGTHRFCALRTGRHVTIAAGGAEVLVRDDVRIGNGSRLEGTAGMPAPMLQVGGRRVDVGARAIITTLIAGPAARVALGDGVRASGAVCADVLRVGRGGTVGCLASSTTSTLTTPTSTTTSSSTATTLATTTTTTVASTTTTTTPALPPAFLDFTTAAPGRGTCGATFRNDGARLRELACGALDYGGGNSPVPEQAIPAGATSRFALTGCSGGACTLGPVATSTLDYDCTAPGCPFGPPLPIASAGTSSCIVQQIDGAVGGTIDLDTGELTFGTLPLAARTHLTGDAIRPCPVCLVPAPASPAQPATGICDRGASAGAPCRTTSPEGLSNDCLPGGTDGSLDLLTLSLPVAPLTTGSSERAAFDTPGGDPTVGEDGLFCPGQTSITRGCFLGGALCRRIAIQGAPAGPLHQLDVPRPVLLAALFCVPRPPGPFVFDPALPGPGAIALDGTFTPRP